MGELLEIEVFDYPAGPEKPAAGLEGELSLEEPEAPGTADSESEGNLEIEARFHAQRAEFDKRLAAEKERSFAAGREKGIAEGREAERAAHASEVEAGEESHARRLANAVEEFDEARKRYLAEIESETVKLALAIAARILRRESQMDPLLLTGAVRVALGQLTSESEVQIRVPAADLELWNEAIRLLPNLSQKVTVKGGEGMQLGDCEIETAVGVVDLGVRGQLAEIERGFFDLAGGRGAWNGSAANRGEKLPSGAEA